MKRLKADSLVGGLVELRIEGVDYTISSPEFTVEFARRAELRDALHVAVDSVLNNLEQNFTSKKNYDGWLPKPTHNGEWAYRPNGDKVAKSVVFVDGITPTDKGYVLADLAGELEGKSVKSLKGTWKRVIIL